MTLIANIECRALTTRLFELATAVLLLVSDTKYASLTESEVNFLHLSQIIKKLQNKTILFRKNLLKSV